MHRNRGFRIPVVQYERGAISSMPMTDPLCRIPPDGDSSKEMGGVISEAGLAESLNFEVIPISFTNDVATMKKISRIKTISIKVKH